MQDKSIQTSDQGIIEAKRFVMNSETKKFEESIPVQPGEDVFIDKASDKVILVSQEHKSHGFDFKETFQHTTEKIGKFEDLIGEKLGPKLVQIDQNLTKIEDKLGEKLDEFGHNVVEFGSKAYDTAADVSTKIYKSTSETVQNVEHKVHEKGVGMYDATKKLFCNSKESLKKGYSNFATFMKNPQDTGLEEITKNLKSGSAHSNSTISTDVPSEMESMFSNADSLFK